jgi:Hexokinase
MGATQESRQGVTHEAQGLRIEQQVRLAQEICEREGIVPLTEDEKETSAVNLIQELESRTFPPTGIYSREKPRPPIGKIVKGIEIGGSTVYVAEILITEKEPEITHSYKRPLSASTYPSVTAFLVDVLTEKEHNPELEQILRSPYDAMVIVDSMPISAKSRRPKLGIDAITVPPLPKGFVIPHIEDRPVGEVLIEDAQIAYPDAPIDERKPLLVLNDTPGVLLSGESVIGGVLGTGHGIAIRIGGVVHNLEISTFHCFPVPPIILEIDEFATENKGERYMEKQVAGKYIGGLLQRLLTKCYQERALPYQPPENAPLEPVHIDMILNRDVEGLADLFSVTPRQIQETILVPYIVALNIRDRARDIVGVCYGALARHLKEYDPKKPVPIDGSVIQFTPGLKEGIEEVATAVAGKRFRFAPQIKNPAMIGGALHVASFL